MFNYNRFELVVILCQAGIPDLPSEGTFGCFVAILSSHTEFGVQLGPDKVQVDGW